VTSTQSKCLELYASLLSSGDKVIRGKREVLKTFLVAFFAKGHVLIEDRPGTGKTTLVKWLAHATGHTFSRIQMTNDLLPSDLVGVSVLNTQSKEFEYHKGPFFADIVLLDELNRASPKTQSACLQAMEESAVTVDGRTYPLPENFQIVATQNPFDEYGTYPIPESQLDRFMFCFSVGYLDRETEVEVLKTHGTADTELNLKDSVTKMSADLLKSIREDIKKVLVSDTLAANIRTILEISRAHQKEFEPLSVRAGLALVQAVRTHAYLEAKQYCDLDDLVWAAPLVLSHRLNANQKGSHLVDSFGVKKILSMAGFV